ncbi:cytochrome P450 [Horticoccus luteus]|uniref:Cytochrome P450 n=1 Tax=Horticoccus luteus TaxID=2862869 RepID=A0A8F9XHD9_9BACT|nr:cytochrome P450 [Horticoccus luteus]QYM79225.1 cytochrome P450 [Horticoccus luteus]
MSRPTIPADLDELLCSPFMLSDPFPAYRRLRREAPVAWSERWQAWVVSRYAEVGPSLKDKESLSNENRQALLFEGLAPQEKEDLKTLRHYFAQKDVIGSDPPDHTRMRGLVQKAFTPKVIASLQPRIERLAEELVGAAAAKGEFDFVQEVAHPLPVVLIAELLGAPPADRELFKTWSADILGFQGSGRTEYATAMVSQRSLTALFNYMTALIEARRKEPRDDLISVLALAEDQGRRLSRDELLATCNTILTAGHETTTNLMGNLVRELLRAPGAWAAVKAEAGKIPGAIEESLRLDAPKQRNFRRIKRTHEFAGVTLPEGQMIFQLIGSANRDEGEFADPDRFDLERENAGDHLSFGAGIHFCLGAGLARAEAATVVKALMRHAPDARLGERGYTWQERIQFRGPGALWVRTR